MVDTSIRTLVEIDVSDDGSKAAQQQIKELVKQQEALAAQFKNSDITAQQYNQQLKELTKQENELKTAIDNATGFFTQQEAAMKSAAQEARKLAQEQERLAQENTAQGRHDKLSQQVGIAGDFSSAAQTIGGVAGGLGGPVGSTIERGVAGVAGIGELVEALPKLKTAAAGLPQALSAGATALGPAGIIAISLAAGVAALTALWKHSIKSMEEDLKSFAAASASFVDFAASGGTQEEARKLNEDEQRRIEFAQKEIVRLREEYAAREFNVMDRLMNDGEQALVDQIKQFETDIRDAQANIERRNEALENNELPKAVKEANEAIEQQIEAQRELEKSISQTSTTTRNSSRETTRRERTKGPQSAGTLGFGFLLGAGKTGEADKAQTEAAEQARDFAAELLTIQEQANDERVKQEIENQRALQDVSRNFGDTRVDTLADQNFLALDKLNTEEARAKRDLSLSNKRANEDINRQAQNANQRLMQESQRYQNDRLRIEQQAYQQGLNQVNTFANGLLNIFGRLQNAGSRTGSTANRQPRTP